MGAHLVLSDHMRRGNRTLDPLAAHWHVYIAYRADSLAQGVTVRTANTRSLGSCLDSVLARPQKSAIDMRTMSVAVLTDRV
jgi:hypothetical protein